MTYGGVITYDVVKPMSSMMTYDGVILWYDKINVIIAIQGLWIS